MTSIDLTARPARLVVRVSGCLDFRTAPKLREVLAEAVTAAPGELVVDCSCVTDVNGPAALAPLVRAAKELRALGGRLRIGSPPPALSVAIRQANLDWMLLYPSESIDLTGADVRAGAS